VKCLLRRLLRNLHRKTSQSFSLWRGRHSKHRLGQVDEGFANLEQAETAADLAGVAAIYRLGHKAMLIDGIPEQFVFAGAVIHHTMSPVLTNVTTIVQQPGLGLQFVKTRREGIEIGPGIPKCVIHIPFEVSDNLVIDFHKMRDRALTAAGALAAVLDERIVEEELFQDVLLVNDEDDEPVVVDANLSVREFLPRAYGEKEQEAIEAIGLSTDVPPTVSVACRWYLRGARTGPAPDSIVSFWVAIEALIPAGGKNTTKQVEAALMKAGTDPSVLPISVGRLYGLRDDIVHKGVEEPDLLREGHYTLETIARTLIRAGLQVESTWPTNASVNDWPSPIKELIDHLRTAHRTHFLK